MNHDTDHQLEAETVWTDHRDELLPARVRAAEVEAHEDATEMAAAYAAGRWCGECRYGVVEDPPCCTEGATDLRDATVAVLTEHAGIPYWSCTRVACCGEGRDLSGHAEHQAAALAAVGLLAVRPVAAQERPGLRDALLAILGEHDHADTCATALSPDAGYSCTCWRVDLIRALTGDATEPASELERLNAVLAAGAGDASPTEPTSNVPMSQSSGHDTGSGQ